MNDKTKKYLKITGIAFLSFVILLMVLPYAFQNKIKEAVITQGNKQLNAKFDFSSVDISFIRNFPKASITLKNFYIKGTGVFATDTLVKAGEATAAINLFSLIGDSGYDISKISLDDAYVHAIVLPDGKTNWDIMKVDSTASTSKEEKTTPFKLKLKKVSVDNFNLIYEDRKENMYANVNQLDATCSGDLGSDLTTLKLKAESKAITYKMGGIAYLSNANVAAKMNIEADMVNQKYTFKENEFRLNAIKTSLDGWVQMKGKAMDMDVKLNSNEIGFKEILSLVPAIYAKDFESIKTSGTASFSAFAKGTMQGDTLPAFDVTMKVKDGTFKYPSVPASVDQITINANVKNPGGKADLTVININPFSFRMAGNPFAITAIIKNPVSDPEVKASAKGTLNLGMVKQVYPLQEGMQLNGVIAADVSMDGRMSYVDKGEYDKFHAAGTVKLTGMKLKMKDMPDVDIQKSTCIFTPQYLHLSETTVNIGKNDLTADCKLENYIAYALHNKTIKGTMNIKSNYFNLNDFMTDVPATEGTTATAAKTSVIEVPRNVDFNMNANMKKVLFSKMTLNDMNGNLLVKEGKVDMKNLSMKTMGGSVVMNGYYSTATSVKTPDMKGAFKLNNIVFAQAFKELEMIKKMAPIFEGLKGDFSGSLEIASKLNSELSPVFGTVQGGGSLSTKNIGLSGVKVIDQIATAVKKESLKNITVKDLNIAFTIKDGKVITKPFDVKLGTTVVTLSGLTGLDQSIDYSGKVKLPASTGMLGQLSSIDLKIGGTFSSPKVSIDTKSMANQAINTVKDKAINELGKKLGIDLGDAKKQKEALMANAQKGADKLIAEAQKQVDALVENAGGNIFKKLAAKKAGDILMKEAQKQADNLVKQAETEGDKIIEKANKK